MRLLWGALLLCPTLAFAECTKDTDCKGDRICTAGQCVDSDRPTTAPVSAVALADRIARVTQLRGELVEMKTDLEEADIVAPIVKVLLSTALGALGGWSLGTWLDSVACANSNYTNCGDSSALWGVGSAVALSLGVAGVIWGAVQLGRHVAARRKLPGEIEAREEQLRILSAADEAPSNQQVAPARASPTSDTGALTEAVVNAVVFAHKDDLLACAEGQHQKAPGISGEVTMRWAVEASGDTSDVEIASEVPGNLAVHSYFSTCLASLIPKWTFPPTAQKSQPIAFPFRY